MMLRYKDMFNFKAALAAVIVCLATASTAASDNCIWCDDLMSQMFMECLYENIPQRFKNLPDSSMKDMKDSIIAASKAITRSNNSTKSHIMNGALAGEIADLIKSCDKTEDPDLIADNLMKVVAECYVRVSAKPHTTFILELGKIVDAMLLDDVSSGDKFIEPINPDSPQKPAAYASSTALTGQNMNNQLQYLNNAPIPVFSQQQTLSSTGLSSSNSNQRDNREIFGVLPNKQPFYQNFPGASRYENFRQNYPQPFVQGGANVVRPRYSLYNQMNAPIASQTLISASDTYSFNPQNRELYAPSADNQPIDDLGFVNEYPSISQNSAPPFLQNNKPWNNVAPNYLMNVQSNQRYQEPTQDIPQAGLATFKTKAFPSNEQNVAFTTQKQVQNLNMDKGALGQGVSYPQNNQAYNLPIQTDQSNADSYAATLYNQYQPNYDFDSNSAAFASASSSSSSTDMGNNAVGASSVSASSGSFAVSNDYTSSIGTPESTAPNSQSKTPKKQKPQRRRSKTSKTVIISNAKTSTDEKSLSSRNDIEMARALKFAENMYVVLSQSNLFNTTFNKEFTNDKTTISIIYDIIINALNDCGYSEISEEIAKACIASIKSFQQQSSSKNITEELVKEMTRQLQMKKKIGENPTAQGKYIANVMLKYLAQTTLATSTLSTDLQTASSVIIADNNDSNMPVSSDNNAADKYTRSQAVNIFYEVLYSKFVSSKYFSYIFNSQTTKKDALSWVATMLSYLYADYGREVTATILKEFVKRISLPENCNTEIYAKEIAKCITDVFLYYNRISLDAPDSQASNIMTKLTEFIKFNKNKQVIDDSDVPDTKNGQDVPQIEVKDLPDNLQMQSKGIFDDGQQSISTSAASSSSSSTIVQKKQQNVVNKKNKQRNRTRKVKIANSEANTNSVAAASTSQQNDYLTNLNGEPILTNDGITHVQPHLPTDNQYPDSDKIYNEDSKLKTDKTSIQILPNENSVESKERIEILMKWAISSMESGKFNYKLFSSVISALTKFAQKTDPKLSSEKALFQILIETIIACTQLLTQLPAECLENKLEDANVSDMKPLSLQTGATDQSSVVQNAQTYSEMQQNNYDTTYQANPSPARQNNYEIQQEPKYMYPALQTDMNVPPNDQSYSDEVNNNKDTYSIQQENSNPFPSQNNYALPQTGYLAPQQTMNVLQSDQKYSDVPLNNEYQNQLANTNQFPTVQNNYAVQQGSAPLIPTEINSNTPLQGQGSWIPNAQNNIPTSQAISVLETPNINTNQNIFPSVSQSLWASNQGNNQYSMLPRNQDPDLPLTRNSNLFSQRNDMITQENPNNWAWQFQQRNPGLIP